MGVDDSYTKALLHFDGADASTTFTDESGKTWTARNHAQIDTAYKKFGTGSGLFDGTDDYIDTPDHADFAVGAGDFTFDFWIKRNGINSDQYLYGQNDSTGDLSKMSTYAAFTDANKIEFGVAYGSNIKYATTAGTLTDTTSFHHIAIERWGNYLVCAIDGVFDANTADMTGITVNNSAYKFSIGRSGEYDGDYLNGQIDEFRFSAGIARWTDDFTPPTVAYGPIALTVANMTLAQILGNVSLTQHNILAAQDITLAQVIGNVALTQHNILAAQNMVLAQVIDNLSLTQHNIIAVQDMTLAQAIESTILTQHNVLAAQDITLAQVLDNLDLTQHNILTVQNMTLAQLLDNITFIPPLVALVVQNIVLGMYLDNVPNLSLPQLKTLGVKQYNFPTIEKGDSFEWETNLTDDMGNILLGLNAATISCIVKSPYDHSVLVDFSSKFALASGTAKLSFNLTPADTAAITWSKGIYWLKINYASGITRTIQYGEMPVDLG